GYGSERIVSIAGAFLVDDPQFAIVVTFAKPVTMRTSAAAAPTFNAIVKQVIKTYRVTPSTEPAPENPLTWCRRRVGRVGGRATTQEATQRELTDPSDPPPRAPHPAPARRAGSGVRARVSGRPRRRGGHRRDPFDERPASG